MIELSVSFFGVFFATFVLTPITNRLGLVDTPDHRKVHDGNIPLVGGIAMFATTALAALFFVPSSSEMAFLLAACALLTMTGSIDDRYDLHYKLRLGVQALSACLLIWGANTSLQSFGNVLGFGDLQLGLFSTPITIIAVIGMINAFNMIDGIDGLSGGLSLITVTALYFLIGDQIADGASNILLLLIGALSAYLVMNLHVFPKWTPKIFMGDAGSMVLGFIITAFLIRYSQGSKQIMMPVTALWLVAVPLLDIFVTCIRRVKHKKNPFHADRTHVHHIFMRAGFTTRTTLIAILGFQVLAAGIGVWLQVIWQNGIISFIAFVALFLAYLQFIKHSFKAAKWLRKNVTNSNPHSK
ncbi:undecaprenyl-phosphate alpha-N-acetylglucosaminyl 1-phosphate transferase [Saccharospirillum impatiens]|uniref:undecaprenyl-phosphate alpha-N-acetylglucosaminyl 1-phosphate transferase n=1 Tax=Saccharospirillum impatiens TaxID=169438 RepID=UPI00040CF4B5|nr:undecaprenyl-phosphate alpha-N-acetylglucosaminyl 1-phosphate transferase [Saccharospirillum impatiens]